MTRNITTSFRRSAEASFTDEAFICFLTITHDSLAEPIRVNWDTVDHTYGGYNFIGFPFDITILSDDENPPTAQLTIQNIDPRIGDSIRALNSPPRIKIELISSADFVGPLLAHFDGADGSTTFINSGNAVPNIPLTAVGNAHIDANSLLLDGSSYVQVSSSSAFAVGSSGDFTVKFKFLIFDINNIPDIGMVMYDSGVYQYEIIINSAFLARVLDESSNPILDEIGDFIYDESVHAVILYRDAPLYANPIIGSTPIQSNVWYRVELIRRSGILRLFLNGVQEGIDYTDVGSFTDTAPVIGAAAGGGWYTTGRIDEFSIVTGSAITPIYSADKLFLINVSVNVMQITGTIVGWDYLQRVWPGPRATQRNFPGLFR